MAGSKGALGAALTALGGGVTKEAERGYSEQLNARIAAGKQAREDNLITRKERFQLKLADKQTKAKGDNREFKAGMEVYKEQRDINKLAEKRIYDEAQKTIKDARDETLLKENREYEAHVVTKTQEFKENVAKTKSKEERDQLEIKYKNSVKLQTFKAKKGGKVDLEKLSDGFFHKISPDGTDLGKLSDVEGKASEKFWAAEKEAAVSSRANTAEANRTKKLDFQVGKESVKQTKDLRAEYKKDVSSLKEMDELIDTVLVGLETGGGLGDKIVKSALSRLGNSKVRALAELNEYKSYGTVIERTSSGISSFLTGEKTDELKKQAMQTVLSFRDKFVRPGLAASKDYYRELAYKDKLDLHSVVRFKNRNSVKKAFTKGWLTEDQATDIIEAMEIE